MQTNKHDTVRDHGPWNGTAATARESSKGKAARARGADAAKHREGLQHVRVTNSSKTSGNG